MAGETVLIVEDRRENIVHLANNLLRPQGYRVLTAMDGQRGLRRILADRPDLVIMDLNMPRMDGLEVLAALRQHQVSVPVILTTFYGSEQVARQALSLGATDYVVKPYDAAEMLGAIERALGARDPETAGPPAPSARELEPPQTPAPAPVREPAEQAMPLTRQMERWMRDVDILTRVGKALVAQLDPEKLYVRSVEAVIYITRADHGCLYLPAGGSRLRLQAMRGPQDPRVRLADAVVNRGLAVDVAALGEAEMRATGPGDAALFALTGNALGPAVAAPLRWEHETLGVLLAARRPGEPPFVEGDAEWLNGLAEYVAIAVRNAHLYTQAAARPGLLPAQEIEELAAELQAMKDRVQRLAAIVTSGPAGGGEPQ